ncbi:hypothetical protein [Streptomyces anulatus]|uniref:hypothetical protein n=1 Tax=Streptomyces anulatus TaxID=1892 RepID=UPI001C27F30D|nr:hypothetical protein [Streptomyces anulatus]
MTVRSDRPTTSACRPPAGRAIREPEDAVTTTGTSLADVLRASAVAGGVALRPLFQGHKFLDHNALLAQGWSAIPFARPVGPARGRDGDTVRSGADPADTTSGTVAAERVGQPTNTVRLAASARSACEQA